MMNAQSATTKLPGDATLPSSKANLEQLASYDKGNFKYKVEDYFARPKASQFKISPDGQFLSYKEKDSNKKNHVYVKDLKSGKITKAIEEKEDLIKSYGWLSKIACILLRIRVEMRISTCMQRTLMVKPKRSHTV